MVGASLPTSGSIPRGSLCLCTEACVHLVKTHRTPVVDAFNPNGLIFTICFCRLTPPSGRYPVAGFPVHICRVKRLLRSARSTPGCPAHSADRESPRRAHQGAVPAGGKRRAVPSCLTHPQGTGDRRSGSVKREQKPRFHLGVRQNGAQGKS